MKIFFTLIIVCYTHLLCAQFRLSAELRPRGEYRHGYKTLVDSLSEHALFVGQRTRLNAFFSKDKLKTGISLQDVRVWGDQSQQNISDGQFSLHEAWFEYNLSNHLSIKAGRQELVYNDHRIFGNSDWNNQGRSHDILLVRWNKNAFNAHAGFAFNQDKEQSGTTFYTIQNNYKTLQYLWLNRKQKGLDISVLFANNGIQSPVSKSAIRYNQISGTHVEFGNDKKRLILKGYYQSGDDGVTKKRINAFMAGAEYIYKATGDISLAAGLEYFRGQSQTDTTPSYKEEIHNFTPYYGTGHKFNGYMDYFYAGSPHGGVGLQDYYLRFKFQRNKLFFYLEPHYFASSSEILDSLSFNNTGVYKSLPSFLGLEIDLSIGYTPSEEISFKAGYSQMFASSALEMLKGGNRSDTNNWAYIMIIVKPDLIP